MVTPCLLVVLGAVTASSQTPGSADRASVQTATYGDPNLSTRTSPAPGPITPEMRGDIFMARKMYREAVEAYRESPSDSAILQNKIGIAYHQMLSLDQARKQYELAVKMSPRYSEAINNLGTIYYAKKSYRRAITYYNRALVVSPNSASIYSNLGTAYFARKKYSEALEAYQKALQLDPEVF